MLNKELFKEQINRLICAYPTWQIKLELSEVMKVWHGRFEYLNDVQFINMVNKYMDTERSNPTIAGLLSCKEEYYVPLTPEQEEECRRKIEESIIEGKSWSQGGEKY